jgi:hypothetical protein
MNIEPVLADLGMNLQQAITMIVAISALFFTGWQALTQRRHNKLSVMPNLRLEHIWEDGVRKVFLRNVGFGPAIITNYTIRYKGKTIKLKSLTDLREVAENNLGGGYYSGGTVLEENQVLEKGESVNIFGIYWHEQHDSYEAEVNVVNFLYEAEIHIKYKSMYGQTKKYWKNMSSPGDFDF